MCTLKKKTDTNEHIYKTETDFTDIKSKLVVTEGETWGERDKSVVWHEHLHSTIYKMGFPGSSSGKEPACQCRRHRRSGFSPWVGKMPCRRPWQLTQIFLPGESRGQRSLQRNQQAPTV